MGCQGKGKGKEKTAEGLRLNDIHRDSNDFKVTREYKSIFELIYLNFCCIVPYLMFCCFRIISIYVHKINIFHLTTLSTYLIHSKRHQDSLSLLHPDAGDGCLHPPGHL